MITENVELLGHLVKTAHGRYVSLNKRIINEGIYQPDGFYYESFMHKNRKLDDFIISLKEEFDLGLDFNHSSMVEMVSNQIAFTGSNSPDFIFKHHIKESILEKGVSEEDFKSRFLEACFGPLHGDCDFKIVTIAEVVKELEKIHGLIMHVVRDIDKCDFPIVFSQFQATLICLALNPSFECMSGWLHRDANSKRYAMNNNRPMFYYSSLIDGLRSTVALLKGLDRYNLD